jgi:peptide-methionine (R)-S-oxide reductase
MTRRETIRLLGVLAGIPAITAACRMADGRADERVDDPLHVQDAIGRLRKSREEWRALLTPAEFAVLFDEATERPFTSPLNKETRDGTYICAACFLPLFSSTAKYDSATGWPSFYEPLAGRTGRKRDWRLVVPRTEYHCIRCRGHQGHVFNDGPPPTGQRWCNNGVALRFIPSAEPLPALRT